MSALIIGAIGVVFGDIGTSPLYTLNEVFAGKHPIAVESTNILGVVSLVFWTIMTLVTLKYVVIIMRADNRGEGGSLALLARVMELAKGSRATWFVIMLGIFAAALFYGDSMITPAISVLRIDIMFFSANSLKIGQGGWFVLAMALASFTTLTTWRRGQQLLFQEMGDLDPCPAEISPMKTFNTEHVLSVHHWNDRLFSFRTTRHPGLRFRNGHFVMIGLEVNGRPLMRAYSIASANHEEYLEFFSIKVKNGPLTSRLQHLKEGDPVLVSCKPVGTLVINDLLSGERLYLLASGTGLAPFLSIIQDPETYERFAQVVLVHGVRHVSELAYADFITHELPENEFLGELAREKLIYYPTVTREPFRNQGRLTHLIETGKLFADLGLPPLDPTQDRVMICGSPGLLKDTCALLNARGFVISPHIGEPGHYVIERTFVEK